MDHAPSLIQQVMVTEDQLFFLNVFLRYRYNNKTWNSYFKKNFIQITGTQKEVGFF